MEEIQTPDVSAIENCLNLIIDAAQLGAQAEAKGGFTISDVTSVIKLAPDLGPALSTMGQVPSELKALNPAAEAQLVAFVTQKLSGMQSARGAEITQAALKAAVATFELLKAIKG